MAEHEAGDYDEKPQRHSHPNNRKAFQPRSHRPIARDHGSEGNRRKRRVKRQPRSLETPKHKPGSNSRHMRPIPRPRASAHSSADASLMEWCPAGRRVAAAASLDVPGPRAPLGVSPMMHENCSPALLCRKCRRQAERLRLQARTSSSAKKPREAPALQTVRNDSREFISRASRTVSLRLLREKENQIPTRYHGRKWKGGGEEPLCIVSGRAALYAGTCSGQ